MNKHRVAIVQSSYIPWKGFFDIIHGVDEFVFLDDVQFTIRDWRSRNRIKTPNGLLWLTVPVGSDRNRLIRDVKLDDPSWQEKHWKTIFHNYAKAPHFGHYRPLIEEMYLGTRWATLSEMNQAMTKRIATEVLGLSTRFTDSREYSPEGSKLDLILDIVRKTGATTYISGPAAKDYIDPLRFHEAGVALEYQDYAGYPEYPQLYPPFEHAVSVLDLMFNAGDSAPHYIWGWRQANPAPTRRDS